MNKPSKSSVVGRVSEVLKSELEKQLFDEKDAVVLTGHESKVIQDFNPAEREAAGSDVRWDDKRFDDFLDRLGALDKSETA